MTAPVCYRVKGVVDPVGGDTRGPCTIVVAAGHVEDVTEHAPPGAAVIDYSRAIAVPGLIDSHTHLSLSLPGDEDSQTAEPAAGRAFRVLGYCEQMLAEGVTTIRLVGEHDGLDYLYRDAFRRGDIAGPRAICSGAIIAPSHVYATLARFADGPAAVTAAVRDNLRRGAEWIKLYATPASRRGNPLESTFAPEELAAALSCARRAGAPVAAHAHGGVAVDHLLAAGVATIEHGRFLSETQLRRMAELDVTLCSTVGIGVFSDVAESGKPVAQALAESEQSIRLAHECGVTVVPGTDAVHGTLRFELSALEYHGLTRLEALQAATSTAGAVVSPGSALGRIAPGCPADFALVAEDPLAVDDWPETIGTIVGGRVAWQADVGMVHPPDRTDAAV